MDKKTNRILGSLLGLALGDAFGAPYEGGILERGLWRLLGNTNGTKRWTDDTQMTINVIESLLDNGCIVQDDLATRFAGSYRWSRGYGPGAAKLLKRIKRGHSWQKASRSVFRDGSFGNGGAMRAPVIGLFFAESGDEVILKAAKQCAEITHAHPLGLEGAILIALATSFSLKDMRSVEILERLQRVSNSTEFTTKLIKAKDWLQQSQLETPKVVAKVLGNGIAAAESCITAIYIALIHRERSFDDLLDYVIKIRGDVDTIAAMAGAIWGAARGFEDLPRAKLEQIEKYAYIRSLAQSLADKLTGEE